MMTALGGEVPKQHAEGPPGQSKHLRVIPIQVSTDQRSILISMDQNIGVEFNRHVKRDASTQDHDAPVLADGETQTKAGATTVSVVCGINTEVDRVDVRSLIGAWENLKMESIDSINDVSADDDGNPRSDDPMGQGVETCLGGPAEKRTTPTEFEVVDDDEEASLSGYSITSMASADMSVEEIKQIYDSFSHATGSDGVKNPDDGHSDALLFDWEKLEHEGETFECDFDLWKFEEVIQEGCYRRLRAFEGFQQFHKLGSREMAGY